MVVWVFFKLVSQWRICQIGCWLLAQTMAWGSQGSVRAPQVKGGTAELSTHHGNEVPDLTLTLKSLILHVHLRSFQPYVYVLGESGELIQQN